MDDRPDRLDRFVREEMARIAETRLPPPSDRPFYIWLACFCAVMTIAVYMLIVLTVTAGA